MQQQVRHRHGHRLHLLRKSRLHQNILQAFGSAGVRRQSYSGSTVHIRNHDEYQQDMGHAREHGYGSIQKTHFTYLSLDRYDDAVIHSLHTDKKSLSLAN